MARKGTSPPSSQDSGTRGARETVAVKKEKARASMRTAVVSDNENDEPSPAKRQRVNEDGDAATPSRETTPAPSRTWVRDAEGYVPGSIVLIKLSNFVTYDEVEFKPGPFLNMIIGPNGTGKSSIACAVALGLNFPPSILGRATEVSSFVKNDQKSGWIEITLKGRAGVSLPNNRKLKAGQDVVIHRDISAASRSSTFKVNGVQASGKEVNRVTADLNLGVGNLCSFLPQDKVTSFAGMSPQELLRETQLAAGDSNLTNWHDTLITTGKELRDMQSKIEEEATRLQQMIQRNENIERDVQRFKERKNIEQEIALLSILIPMKRYRENYEIYQRAKMEQRRLHNRVKNLKGINEPAHKKLDEMAKEIAEYDEIVKKQKNAIRAGFEKLRKAGEKDEDFDRKIEKAVGELDGLKQKEKDRKERLAKADRDVVRLQDDLDKNYGPEKDQEWAEALERLGHELSAVNREYEDMKGEHWRVNQDTEEFLDNLTTAKEARRHAGEELTRCDQASNVKLQALKRWSPDTHDAVVWLRAHKHLFRQEVFEPPVLSVEMKDMRYVDHVEGCFNKIAQMTFVAQNQEDSDTMNRVINDERGLGRHARISVWYNPNQQIRKRSPMDETHLRQMGFDGYALDFITYPPGMEVYLKNEVNLHTIAIALSDRGIDFEQVMNIYGNNGGGRFMVGRTLSNVTRSAYGRREVSNMTSDLAHARNFIQQVVDPAVKQAIKERFNEANAEFEQYEKEKPAIMKRVDETNAMMEKAEKQRNSIINKRKKITDDKSVKSKIAGRLAQAKANLSSVSKLPSVDKERAQLRHDINVLVGQRIKNVEQFGVITREILDSQKKCTKLHIEHLQLVANRAHLQKLCDEKSERYNKALADFREADQLFTNAKKAAQETRDAHAELQREYADDPEKSQIAARHVTIHQATQEYKDRVSQVEAQGGDASDVPKSDHVDLRSIDDLERDLETEQTKLEMNLNTNPGVVEQYEKRKKDIEQTTKTLDEMRARAQRKERDIKNAKDNWQPALQKLVSSIGKKFSAAFDKKPGGGAGEIRIHEDEDFEKWAIDIMVKFRETEKMQLLTAQRQSGGERSLSTILYLMSLSSEARAPFSLVDEINQGMDQRAERMVHNLLVDVTCQPDSGQYFLITPKLLPDLHYHERMKVLIVNNGEWLPDEEKGLGNMMTLINRFADKRGGRAASAL